MHEADEEMARTGKAAASNEARVTSYLLKGQLYKTFWVLARGGATKIIPIRELSAFSDGETIDVPGQPRALHAPGHTAGSAVLLAEGRSALFAGDVLCGTGGVGEAVRLAKAAGPS